MCIVVSPYGTRFVFHFSLSGTKVSISPKGWRFILWWDQKGSLSRKVLENSGIHCGLVPSVLYQAWQEFLRELYYHMPILHFSPQRGMNRFPAPGPCEPHGQVPEATCAWRQTMESGLLMLYTSVDPEDFSAAFGQAFRALGRGLNVCIVQFVNDGWNWDEIASSARFEDRLEIHLCPGEFTWKAENLDVESEAAHSTWELALEKIESEAYELIVLDELATVLSHAMLDETRVVNTLKNKPENLTVIVTGQNASSSLIEASDLVTQVKNGRAVGT